VKKIAVGEEDVHRKIFQNVNIARRSN
jgi:hypothetical protein